MTDHDLPIHRATGVFDEAAARALVAAVARGDRAVAAVVDLSAATDVQDHELAILGEGLAGCGRPVVLRGLSLHHLRVLRYLGLDGALGATPPPAGPAGVAA